jgi:hypothetical protein
VESQTGFRPVKHERYDSLCTMVMRWFDSTETPTVLSGVPHTRNVDPKAE